MTIYSPVAMATEQRQSLLHGTKVGHCTPTPHWRLRTLKSRSYETTLYEIHGIISQ